MIVWLVCLLLTVNQPPRLAAVPDSLRPYVKQLQRENEFRAWLLRHQDTVVPLSDFIEDGTQSAKKRRRAWQFRAKIRNRKS